MNKDLTCLLVLVVFIPFALCAQPSKKTLQALRVEEPPQIDGSLDYLLRSDQINSLSVRALYYLDYLSLRPKNRPGGDKSQY